MAAINRGRTAYPAAIVFITKAESSYTRGINLGNEIIKTFILNALRLSITFEIQSQISDFFFLQVSTGNYGL